MGNIRLKSERSYYFLAMANEHSDLVNEVARKIGVNILLFQKIEKGLKILIPFIAKPGCKKQDFKLFQAQREAVRTQTLGQLVNSFVESADYNSDYFSERLQKIVENRNALVHHFGGALGMKVLETQAGCMTCLAELEAQRQEAYSFYEVIRSFACDLACLLRGYGVSRPELEAIYEEYQKQVSDEAEYVNLRNASSTVWGETKIVKLLRLAESHTAKVNGMTSLSRAGKFIKSQDPACTSKRYGVKTLKAVLEVSGLFEVGEGKGGHVLYRSRTLIISKQWVSPQS